MRQEQASVPQLRRNLCSHVRKLQRPGVQQGHSHQLTSKLKKVMLTILHIPSRLRLSLSLSALLRTSLAVEAPRQVESARRGLGLAALP